MSLQRARQCFISGHYEVAKFYAFKKFHEAYHTDNHSTSGAAIGLWCALVTFGAGKPNSSRQRYFIMSSTGRHLYSTLFKSVSRVAHTILTSVMLHIPHDPQPNSNPFRITKGESVFVPFDGIHFHMKGLVLSNPFIHFHLVEEHNTTDKRQHPPQCPANTLYIQP